MAGESSNSFQATRSFCEDSESKWHNRLIFGDNLQAMEFILDDWQLEEKVRLVYIDPPFGTGKEYDANGIPAYSSALRGTEYLKFLRERLVLLKDLLAEDGSIFVRIDYHYGHYVKVLLDEVFGRDNFRNEIVVNRTKKIFEGIRRFNTATDSVFFYTKTDDYLFNGFRKKRTIRKWIPMHSPGVRWTKVDDENLGLFKTALKEKKGQVFSRARIIFGREMMPPSNRHWTFTQKKLDKMTADGRIRLNPRTGVPEYFMSSLELVDSNWTDIPGYTFRWKYPTENSEQLLERVVVASSKPDDIVLDCFAGSGTTGAVAEKLGRRWIMVDASKLSISTIIRRMHNLRTKIGNSGPKLKSKPFTLYTST